MRISGSRSSADFSFHIHITLEDGDVAQLGMGLRELERLINGRRDQQLLVLGDIMRRLDRAPPPKPLLPDLVNKALLEDFRKITLTSRLVDKNMDDVKALRREFMETLIEDMQVRPNAAPPPPNERIAGAPSGTFPELDFEEPKK